MRSTTRQTSKTATLAADSSRTPAFWTYAAVVELFEHVPDTVFFVKDAGGRYQHVNSTLAERCGLASKQDLIGRHPTEVFPADLGARYSLQDAQVLRSGLPITDHLELHWYPRRRTGWCLTTKLPIKDETGRFTGVIGISRDLPAFRDAKRLPASLARVLDSLESRCGDKLTVPGLARESGLAPTRFARLIRRIFRITPSQLITHAKLSVASRLLAEGQQSVADVALACGFTDHSAFSRVFKRATGLTPTEFRGRERAV